jgi:cell wall-associated NlpC family hydrolase
LEHDVNPQPGDFGLTTISGTVGRLIRFGQWLNGDGFSVYEHAFIVIPGGKLVEAEPGGARIGELSEYTNVSVDYSSWPLTDEQRHAVVGAATALLSTPYSALDYLALATHRLHIPAPGLRSYISSTGHMICSQLVDEVYRRAGVQLFNDGRWPGFVTPGSLRCALTGPVGRTP